MKEKTMNFLKKAKVLAKQFLYDAFVFPVYILTHPIKGFEELKDENKGKLYISVFYSIMMILASVVVATKIGFLATGPQNVTFNLGKTALLVLIPLLLVTVGNWSITTLFEGKGNMKEIFMVITYGLIPYIWVIIPATLISNFLIQSEIQFYFTFIGIGTFFAAYLIFMGLLVIHEYGLFKTFLTIIFTIVAAAVIVFIGLLILTLFQQVYGFVKAVYEELILRMS